MDPHYMDNCEFDTSALHPYNEKKRRRRSCEIKVVHDLLGLVSLLGIEKELGWGGEDSLADYI